MSYLVNEPVEKEGYECERVGHMVGSSLTFFWGQLLTSYPFTQHSLHLPTLPWVEAQLAAGNGSSQQRPWPGARQHQRRRQGARRGRLREKEFR